jgi:hypothetical protein
MNSGWTDLMGPDSLDPQDQSGLFHMPGAGSTYSDPEFSWASTIAPTAILFPVDSSLGDEYDDVALVADNNNGKIYAFPLNAGRTGFALTGGLADLVANDQAQADGLLFGSEFGPITDLELGPDGHVYAVAISRGNVYRIFGGGPVDSDADGVPDASDNCPTVANAGQQDGGGGLELPADGVGNACDNCVNASNPRVPGGTTAYLAANPWATLTGGQRDDDHDGYGNTCDGDFGNNNSTTIADTNQYKASLGESKQGDTCGTANNRPCAIFDINSGNSTESSATGANNADTARYKLLLGNAPGPRCAACTGTGSVPLPCTAGSAGGC